MNTAIRLLGAGVLRVVLTLGQMVLTLGHTLRALVLLRVPLREVLRQLYVCGVMAVPVTVLASVCVGCIVAVQGMDYVRRYSAPQVFGWAAFLSATREVGPLLMGLLISARLGAWHAAELAALNVTERVDALRALAVDPWRVLVAPRLVAMPLAGVMLMLISNAVSLSAATAFAWALGGVTPWVTWGSIADLSQWSDLVQGLWKAGTYGWVAGLGATSVGMDARGGAEAVGHAVTRAAVSTLVIIVITHHALTVGFTP
jgi:phospholipid/cholesterol/gamma-HCH transport system permease protein